MKHLNQSSFRLFCSTIISLIVFNANGQDTKESNPMAELAEVHHLWARETFALAKTGAAYMMLSNTSSKTPIYLESVSVDDSIAATVELHTTLMQEDMMTMQQLEEPIEILSQQTVEFKPGGKHIMFMGLEKPFLAGEKFVISLHFTDGSYVQKEVIVKDGRGGMDASKHNHH
ncbi:copper chaperone PCu(A)C [Glaciecola sp. 1036]|uniref:copper chaperone PCu(A)C n=1 Tax=Alteromonadaceae TaxID=72275 RepID=UPI003D007395